VARTERGHAGIARTIAGLTLIVAVAPVFLLLVPGSKNWIVVVVGGLVAFAVLMAGIALAGEWLGVVRRRREQGLDQQGCLQLFATMLALVAFGVILYYVVYYGASAYMRGVP